jgi:chromosome segregation ATPase
MKKTNQLFSVLTMASGLILAGSVDAAPKTSSIPDLEFEKINAAKTDLMNVDETLRSNEETLRQIRQTISNGEMRITAENVPVERRDLLQEQINRDRRDVSRFETYVNKTVADLRQDVQRIRDDEAQLDRLKADVPGAMRTETTTTSSTKGSTTTKGAATRTTVETTPEIARLEQKIREEKDQLRKDLAQLQTDEQRLEKEARNLRNRATAMDLSTESMGKQAKRTVVRESMDRTEEVITEKK